MHNVFTFYRQLYRNHKLLAAAVTLYAAGLLFFALKQQEQFPFLLYGMYSLPEKPQPAYTLYEIVIDGKKVVYPDLWDAQRELVQQPLHQYMAKKKAGYTTPAEDAAYRDWLFRYCADMRTLDNNTMQVYEITARPGPGKRLTEVERTLVLTYADE